MNNPLMPNATSTPTPAMPGFGGANDAFEVDLTNAGDSAYCVPNGTYRAKCVDVTQEVSKSGNPMFVWNFELTGGQYSGKSFKSWTSVTPAAMWKVAETVEALGVGQTGQVVRFKRSDVIGKECGVVMEQEEYNGKMTSKIISVIPVSEVK